MFVDPVAHLTQKNPYSHVFLDRKGVEPMNPWCVFFPNKHRFIDAHVKSWLHFENNDLDHLPSVNMSNPVYGINNHIAYHGV
jgi:hypothetical protein